MKVLLIAYDNGSHLNWFPQGLAYISSVLIKNGHAVEIWHQDLNHWPDEYLTKRLDKNDYDIVGLSIIAGYYQYQRLIGLSKAVQASKNNPFYIIGGHMCAPDPEYFLNLTKADCIVLGEGEDTIVDIIAMMNGELDINKVYGAAFRTPEGVVINDKRALLDIDTISRPAYSLFPISVYRLLRMPHCEATDFIMPILSGRGCPYKCNFCYRMDEGFRPRAVDDIVGEMEYLNMVYGINYFCFSDELLMASVKRTKELCEAFTELQKSFKFKWDCNGRLNFAKPEVLQMMKDAGCVFINYGIEAFDNTVLRNMNKALTCEQIETGIRNTLDVGISPGFNIIWGNIGDDLNTLFKGAEFLLRYDDGAQMRTIRPCTAYPGTPLFEYAKGRGLCLDTEDFYLNKHKNSDLLSMNFTDLTDDQFHKALYRTNSVLLSNYHHNRAKKFQQDAKTLYLEGDASYRGFRRS